MTQEDRFINTAQLSELLGVSSVTIWRWRKNSQLPSPYKFNEQSVRWRRSEIESWLTGKEKVKPSSPLAEETNLSTLDAMKPNNPSAATIDKHFCFRKLKNKKRKHYQFPSCV